MEPEINYRQVEVSSEQSTVYYFVKRIMDLIGALCGIILMSPIVLITIVAIKLESKGPILFSQEQVG